MPTIKYTGQSHFREISAADFKRVGVDNQTQVKLARHDIFAEQNHKGHDTTVDVSQEAADWLLANEPGDWALVEDDESESEAPASDEEVSTSPSASDAPDGIGLDSPSQGSGAAKKSASKAPR